MEMCKIVLILAKIKGPFQGVCLMIREVSQYGLTLWHMMSSSIQCYFLPVKKAQDVSLHSPWYKHSKQFLIEGKRAFTEWPKEGNNRHNILRSMIAGQCSDIVDTQISWYVQVQIPIPFIEFLRRFSKTLDRKACQLSKASRSRTGRDIT